VSKVARWESVWEICEVWGWVGGRTSGSVPRRRAEESGPWVVRCSSSVREDGGIVRFFAYFISIPASFLREQKLDAP
jgi:hypothetical protein